MAGRRTRVGLVPFPDPPKAQAERGPGVLSCHMRQGPTAVLWQATNYSRFTSTATQPCFFSSEVCLIGFVL